MIPFIFNTTKWAFPKKRACKVFWNAYFDMHIVNMSRFFWALRPKRMIELFSQIRFGKVHTQKQACFADCAQTLSNTIFYIYIFFLVYFSVIKSKAFVIQCVDINYMSLRNLSSYTVGFGHMLLWALLGPYPSVY